MVEIHVPLVCGEEDRKDETKLTLHSLRKMFFERLSQFEMCAFFNSKNSI